MGIESEVEAALLSAATAVTASKLEQIAEWFAGIFGGHANAASYFRARAVQEALNVEEVQRLVKEPL